MSNQYPSLIPSQPRTTETTSHNLSSINTEGFRTSRPEFEGIPIPSIPSTHIPSQPQHTPLDLAISGNGFFQVQLPFNNQIGYTRYGAFRINSDSVVVTEDGSELYPRISIPSNRQSVTVASDGQISVVVEGTTSATNVGNIQLANFINPDALEHSGSNIYTATAASGDPLIGTPGTEAFGTIVHSTHSEISETERIAAEIAARREYERASLIQQSDQTNPGPRLI